MYQINSESWISSICRTCLLHNKSEVSDIRETTYENVDLTKILAYFAPILKIEFSESSRLPPNICNECTTLFYYSYTFLKSCEKAQSDLKLRLSIVESKNNDNLVQITLKNQTFTCEGEQYPAILEFPPDDVKTEPDVTDVSMVIDDDDSCHSDSVRVENDGSLALILQNIQTDLGSNPIANSTESVPKEKIICIENDGNTNDIQGDSKFKCDVCDKELASRTTLKLHMRLHEGKLFQCTACDKSYATKESLRLHERAVHQNIKYPCTKCDRVYNRKPALAKHMKTHFVKIIYQCDKCPKKFNQRTSWREHQRQRHEGDTTYQCKECSLLCRNRRALEAHLRTHTGERPFVCSYCGQTFTQKTRLNKHVKYHTGELSHKCAVCPEQFQTTEKLREHAKVHATIAELKQLSFHISLL